MSQSAPGLARKCSLRVMFAVLLIVAFFPRTAAAQNYVLGRMDTPVPPNARVMATGDFNHDGILDFAVATDSIDGFSQSVTILLGNLHGTATPTASFPSIPSDALAIIAADLNGDGNPDLALASGTELMILIGNGDGTFQPVKTTELNLFARSLAAGDMNGDGKLDIVMPDSTGQQAAVFIGNGDGTFQAPAGYPLGFGPTSVTLADFNHDGKLDIAALGSFPNQMSILLNKGDGTFLPHVDYSLPSSPAQAVAADLNGDGNVDIVIANTYTPGGVVIATGKGDGTFTVGTPYVVGTGSSSVTIGDFNGDSKQDVAIADFEGNFLAVLIGNGDGTLQPAAIYPSGYYPQSIAAVDFNGDGKLDLAFLNGTTNDGNTPSVSVLLGHGDGTFHADTSYASSGMFPNAVVTADFNNDGRPDLAMADLSQTGGVSILLNTGAGKFGPSSAVSTLTMPLGLASGDFNGDKNIDLLVSDRDASSNGQLEYFAGNGDGSFQPSVVSPITGGGVQQLVAADFNGDGKLDMAAIEQQANVVVFLGAGNGKFGTPATYGAGQTVVALVAGDLNGDGKPDLVASNEQDGTLSVYINKGDGTFFSQVVYNTNAPGSFGQTGSVLIADVNGDSKPDLVTVTTNNDYVVFLGNGDGTFAQTPISSLINRIQADVMQAGDFNGDGKIDLVIGSQPASASIVYGNGDGTLTTETDFAMTQSPFTLAVADFNGDGTLDFAIPNLGLGNVTVFLSEPSAFVYPSMLTFASEPQGGTSAPQNVTITNPSAVPFTVTGVTTAGDFGATNNCTEALKGGVYASCKASVTFSPTGSGTRMGTLSFADAVPGNPQMVALKGTASAGPAVSLSPKAFTFTQVVNTTSDAKIVTLGNTGTAALTLTSAISVSGDYTETDNCGTSVAVGGSCTINVTFAPTATGARNGVLTINDNAAGSPHTVGLTGVSVEFTIAPAAGSPTSVTVTAGQQATYQLTLIGVSDFSGQAALACTGAPSEATCSVSPASATLTGATPASATVTVTTTAASNVVPAPSGDGGKPRAPIAVFAVLAAIMSMMAMFLAASLRSGSRSRLSRYRVAFQAVLALAAFASLAALTSCGGGGGKGPTNPGTPAGTYTLTVTGTLPVGSGTATHSQALTLIVQ
jgi:hypothetical protein